MKSNARGMVRSIKKGNSYSTGLVMISEVNYTLFLFHYALASAFLLLPSYW